MTRSTDNQGRIEHGAAWSRGRPNIGPQDEAEGASDEKVFVIGGRTGSKRWLGDRGCSNWNCSDWIGLGTTHQHRSLKWP